MFKYYAMKKDLPEYEKIAVIYSSEYLNEADTFKKKDILEKLKGKIDGEIKAASAIDYYVVEAEHRLNLNPYDEKTKSFTLSLTFANQVLHSSSTLRFPGYDESFRFSNIYGMHRIVPQNEEQARAIEAMRSSNPNTEYFVRTYSFASGLVDQTIQFYIHKAELVTEDGKVVFTYNLKS